MENSVINLHLSSVNSAETRNYKLRHCKIVSWLMYSFNGIKSGEITYEDYKSFGDSLGINTYKQECFEAFREQEYV